MPVSVSIKRVEKIIGKDAVEILMKELPGMTLYIPKKGGLHTDKDTRNDHIRQMYYAGKSYEDIAEIFQLSQDHIRKIITNR